MNTLSRDRLLDPAARPEELAAVYRRDGMAAVISVLSADECEDLKQEALTLLAEDRKSVLVAVSGRSDRYRRLSEDPRIIDRLAPLFPEGITFQSDKFVYKNQTQRFATPWHFDAQYWSGKRPKLSVWIPLDDVSEENGTLTVIPGSHEAKHREVRVDGSETNGEFRSRVDVSGVPADQQLALELPRGSVVIFSDRLLHASTPNTSGRSRYAIISTYHGTRDPDPEPAGPVTKVLTRRPLRDTMKIQG